MICRWFAKLFNDYYYLCGYYIICSQLLLVGHMGNCWLLIGRYVCMHFMTVDTTFYLFIFLVVVVEFLSCFILSQIRGFCCCIVGTFRFCIGYLSCRFSELLWLILASSYLSLRIFVVLSQKAYCCNFSWFFMIGFLQLFTYFIRLLLVAVWLLDIARLLTD